MHCFARAVLATALVICAWSAVDQRALADPTDRQIEHTAFYRAPLMCPAARGLGCGSRAKPMLLSLEKAPAVQEAWLDHAGETLAVVWNSNSTPAERIAALAATGKAHGVPLVELEDPAREALAASFQTSKGWYRGADVDRLSDEEAQVIADRLLNRLFAEAPTAKRKANTIRPTLTDTIRRQLVGMCPSRSECLEQFMTSAREHLSDAEVSALRQAIELGYRPVGNEQ